MRPKLFKLSINRMRRENSIVLRMKSKRLMGAQLAKRHLRTVKSALLLVTKSVMDPHFITLPFTNPQKILLLRSIGLARDAILGTSLGPAVNHASSLDQMKSL